MGTMNEQIKKLLEIVGTEDGDVLGKEGRIELTGELGDAALDQTGWVAGNISHSKGKPIGISRFGRLELWCDGLYVEYRDVRPKVYRALRHLGISTNMPAVAQ
jgi:hypothetical protein